LVVLMFALGVGAVAAAPAAMASVTIGQTSTSPDFCNGASNYIDTQLSTGPAPSYAAPADGVITSWSTYVGSTTSGVAAELKVFDPATTKVTAQSGAQASLQANQLNTFSASPGIPIRAGETIAIGQPSGKSAYCQFSTASSSDDITTYGPDGGPGETLITSGGGGGLRVNISAVVEPDADHDGFGDETQDQCPTDASTQGPCPAQPAAPGPSPFIVPFGGVQLGSQTLTVKNGKVTVTLLCPATSQGNCVGVDTLNTAGKVVAPRLTAAKKAKILTLGKGSFSIAAGHSGKVTIRLNKTALKLLAKKHTLKVKQTIVAHDSRNVSKTTSGNLKLKAAKPKNKH
jgi:hypothetical protein